MVGLGRLRFFRNCPLLKQVFATLAVRPTDKVETSVGWVAEHALR
jgi:hypothetical protein